NTPQYGIAVANPSAAVDVAGAASWPAARFASVSGGHHQHLFERRLSVASPVDADHAKRFHAFFYGDFAHFACAGTADHQFTNGIAHGHGFNDGETSGVTRTFAAVTTPAAEQLDALECFRVNVQVFEHLCRIRDRLFAMRTDTPHQALGAGQNN